MSLLGVSCFVLFWWSAEPGPELKPEATTVPAWETIQLKSGHTVRGIVLLERDNQLIIDVGIDVLKVPTEKVASRSTATATENSGTNAAAGDGKVYGQSPYLFATADLPEIDANQLVNRFGEAVVLVKTPGGLGSGFIIDKQGHCITNAHVVEGETRITVDIFEKQTGVIRERSISDVQLIAINPFYDLALLRIPKQPNYEFETVYFGFAEEIRQGDRAIAIGNPEGLTRSVTQGIVSNKNRSFEGQVYIQTTTQINPGNSGGPLFNGHGQVIGVTNMKRTFSEGLGFAIPISYVKDFLQNREAFSYNKDNPNTGYIYLDPPRRKNPSSPDF